MKNCKFKLNEDLVLNLLTNLLTIFNSNVNQIINDDKLLLILTNLYGCNFLSINI